MNADEIRCVLRELRMILDSLCSAELNGSGRSFIMKRIRMYENKLSQIGT